MFLLQTLIHYVEVGTGSRFFNWTFRIGFSLFAILLLAFAYNFCAFKNFSTQEAMDCAQLARNIAQGRGYTTHFVRPFSMYLVKQRNQERESGSDPDQPAASSEIKGMHPDIANAPLYPFLLAGLMNSLHFRYPVDSTHMFWSRMRIPPQREFWRYQPD